MASPGNQHCVNCIGTLSLPIGYRHCSELRRLVVNTIRYEMLRSLVGSEMCIRDRKDIFTF